MVDEANDIAKTEAMRDVILGAIVPGVAVAAPWLIMSIIMVMRNG